VTAFLAAPFFAGAFAAEAFFAGLFAAAAFLAGASSAAFALWAGAFFGAALAVLEADFRVVAVDELEDTNYLSVRHVGHFSGAARPVPVNSRAPHSGTDIHTTRPWADQSRGASRESACRRRCGGRFRVHGHAFWVALDREFPL
jgi:hypothetical protein